MEKKTRAAAYGTAAIRQARRAVADAASRCGEWNISLARMSAHLAHTGGTSAPDFADGCADIISGIGEARQQLIVNLMDAPQAVCSNSRVTDIHRVLDRIERSARDIQAATHRTPQPPVGSVASSQ